MDQPVPAKWKVRTALREATGAVHERLHQARPFTALMNKQLDVSGYTDLLRRIAAFHFTVGPELGLDDARGKLLAQDLDVLGSSAPARLSWRSPQSRAARLGWAYVVEGSSLGGKVIYRQLDYLFGDSAQGRCFFKGSGVDRIRWQMLCHRLEAEGRNFGAVGEMIGGANDAFELFEQALLSPVPAHV
jgi:heme oxygenase (biliverdin-IX-beta and delta-forming)